MNRARMPATAPPARQTARTTDGGGASPKPDVDASFRAPSARGHRAPAPSDTGRPAGGGADSGSRGPRSPALNCAGAGGRGDGCSARRGLLEVLGDQLGHLEHADLLLAAEDLLERLVRVDHAAVLAVLELVLLDVFPELLGHLRAWHRLRPDDVGERVARRHRLHESGARLPTFLG